MDDTALNDPVEVNLQITDLLDARALLFGAKLMRPQTDTIDMMWATHRPSNLCRNNLINKRRMQSRAVQAADAYHDGLDVNVRTVAAYTMNMDEPSTKKIRAAW